MTKDNLTNTDEAKAAFEEWFFERRKQWRDKGIELSVADANSMWDGWQAAWSKALIRFHRLASLSFKPQGHLKQDNAEVRDE